jgi:GNAT superfamily N-acetyltransferase
VEHARLANAADLPAVTALSDMAVSEVSGQRGGSLLVDSLLGGGPLEETLAGALDDPDRVLVVGTTDGVPVGFALARYDRTRRQPIGVIDTVYVEPSARQVGVGEAIVDLIVSWCAARGCRGVDAPALPGSRPTKAFFEDNGFVARLLVMHHPIPGSGG